MPTSLIVPLAQDQDPIREANWAWLRSRWEATLPASWAIVEGRAPAEPWVKANATQDAAQAALAGTWIVLDADVLLDPAVLVETARIVDAGEAEWVHPHRVIYRLAAGPTRSLVDHPPDLPHDQLPLPTTRNALDRNIYQGSTGGGIVTCSSDAYHRTGGFDPRFVGWGGEDVSFGRALRTLCGEPACLEAPLWHLWHPPQPRPANPHRVQRKASVESDRLSGRYVAATGRPDKMRELIAERSP